MRSWLVMIFGMMIAGMIGASIIYTQKILPNAQPVSTEQPIALPSSPASATPSLTEIKPTPDLSVDSTGLSKATVTMVTSEGTIKFKFYSNDARKTVNRVAELIRSGFYNGKTFHRVVPTFVIQGGDPQGDGTGGTGQKLEAEFNDRKHLEGTLAMARVKDDLNSADSQFYICLSPQPQLDHKYTVFGQVIEGMDVVRKIKIGDKMVSLTLQ